MKIALRALHGCSVDRKHFSFASVNRGGGRGEIERGESTCGKLCVQLVSSVGEQALTDGPRTRHAQANYLRARS